MGDTNVALDSTMDRKYAPEASHSHDLAVEEQIRDLLQSHGLVDTWRELHPLDRNYIFYSNRQKSFCRIYRIFIPLWSISNICKIMISTSPWSDHDPITFLFTLLALTHPAFQWQRNDSLLTSRDAFLNLHSRLQAFLLDNKGYVTGLLAE